MERGGSQNNIDWEDALRVFHNAIAQGNKSLKIKAMSKLALLAERAPEHALSRTIPILIRILRQNTHNDPPPSLQELAAYCLKCIACVGKGGLAIAMGRQGATLSLIRLLPQYPEGNMQEVLINWLLVLVTFCDTSRRVVAVNGGTEIIINLLNSPPNNDTRPNLLEILSVLALKEEDVRKTLIRLRALHLIVEAASTGSMVSRESACESIRLLAESGSELVEIGTIPMLVELLRNGDQSTKLIAAKFLHLLYNHVDCNTRPFTQAGVIPLYVELLQGHDHSGKEIAVDVLSLLAVREDSAVEIVGHLMVILRDGDDESKASAADVMWDLSGYESSSSVIRDSGAIPILVELLGSGTDKVMENVSRVFVQLSYDGAGRMSLVKAGAIPILMDLLHHENAELRDTAAEAIFNFYEDPLHHHRVSHAFDVPSFKKIQNRASDEHMTRSFQRRSLKQLIGNLDLLF